MVQDRWDHAPVSNVLLPYSHWSQHSIQVHKWYTSTTAAPQLLDPVAVIAVSVHVHCVVAMLLSAHISDVPKLWLLIEVHNACECF